MADTARSRLEVIKQHLSPSRFHLKSPENSETAAVGVEIDSLVVPNDVLTEEEIDFYNKNGYLVVRNLVPQELLDKYLHRFQQICNGEVRVPSMTVMKDVTFVKSNRLSGEKTINKLQNFEEDEVLFSYCQLPGILKYVACFTGPDIKSMHTMLINKPPDPGTMTSRHPLHQDLHYFPFRPANRMVCSWTAMERVHRRNGCLMVQPGTQYSSLLQHFYPEWEVRETHHCNILGSYWLLSRLKTTQAKHNVERHYVTYSYSWLFTAAMSMSFIRDCIDELILQSLFHCPTVCTKLNLYGMIKQKVEM